MSNIFDIYKKKGKKYFILYFIWFQRKKKQDR